MTLVKCLQRGLLCTVFQTWSTFQGLTTGWRSCMRDLGQSSLKAMESYTSRHFSRIWSSNGNASETKATESFDNGVFFDIEAKQTPSIVSKLLSKRSEHIRWNKNYFRSKANTFDSKTTVFKAKSNMSDRKKIIFEAKQTHYIERKLFSKRTH